MVYHFFGQLVPKALKVYFKKFYISRKENLDLSKPIIMACNHPNSFLDAVVIAAIFYNFNWTPPYFLARGDAFKKQAIRWFLHQLKILPIFRISEGSSNLSKNEDTFKQCYSLLENTTPVGIFSEGICVVEKRLRPLKKGTARMAFGAEEKNNWQLGLQIVPTGINYTYPKGFRSEYMLDFGAPIMVKDYRELYEENDSKAVNQLTEDLRNRMKSLLIIIEKKDDDELVEGLLQMLRSESIGKTGFRHYSFSRVRLEAEQDLANTVNEMPDDDKEELKKKVQDYYEELENSNLSDHSVWKGQGPNVADYLWLIIAPLHWIGMLTHAPVAKFAHKKASQIKQDQFFASAQFLMAFIIYILLYPVLLIPAFFVSWKVGVIIFAGLVISAYTTVYFGPFWKAFREKIKIKQLKKQGALAAIQQKRNVVSELFEKLRRKQAS